METDESGCHSERGKRTPWGVCSDDTVSRPRPKVGMKAEEGEIGEAIMLFEGDEPGETSGLEPCSWEGVAKGERV